MIMVPSRVATAISGVVRSRCHARLIAPARLSSGSRRRGEGRAMGAWGGGLYDGDFALDLKGTIKGVLRAPLSDDEVLAEIWTSHGARAGELDALDYWLVLADQLERQGIRRPDIFERAIAIVEAGEDLAMLAQLEAEPKTLAERRKETAKLAAR